MSIIITIATDREDILTKMERGFTQGLDCAAKAKGAPTLRRNRGRPWSPMPERPPPGRATCCRKATDRNLPTADSIGKRMKEESEGEARKN